MFLFLSTLPVYLSYLQFLKWDLLLLKHLKELYLLSFTHTKRGFFDHSENRSKKTVLCFDLCVFLFFRGFKWSQLARYVASYIMTYSTLSWAVFSFSFHLLLCFFFPSNVHGLQTLGIKIIAGWLMGHHILLLCLFCSRESVYLQCRHVLWCQLRDTLNL